MKTIAFTVAATKQWVKLSAPVRRRIDLKLLRYAETGSGDVKGLAGREGARLRVGDWRVIFIEDSAMITVVAVGHRRAVYHG